MTLSSCQLDSRRSRHPRYIFQTWSSQVEGICSFLSRRTHRSSRVGVLSFADVPLAPDLLHAYSTIQRTLAVRSHGRDDTTRLADDLLSPDRNLRAPRCWCDLHCSRQSLSASQALVHSFRQQHRLCRRSVIRRWTRSLRIRPGRRQRCRKWLEDTLYPCLLSGRSVAIDHLPCLGVVCRE